MHQVTRAVGLIGVLAVGTACVSQTEFNRLQIENERLARMAESRRVELERARSELLDAKAVADTHEDTASIYKDWVTTLEDKVKDLEIATVTIVTNEEDGTSQVNLSNSILFDSGSILIKDLGRKALTELATTLKDAPGILRIEGHTDNQPVKSHLVKQHSRDNWQLSVNRSLAVLRILMAEGVPPSKLSVVGYGEHQPIAENGKKGRLENRRVEILFVPETLVDEEETPTITAETIRTVPIAVEEDGVTPEETTEGDTTEDPTQND